MLKQNRHHYNNGIINISLKQGDLVPIGFTKGRLPISEETRDKLSKSHKGKKHTEETKQKISKNSNNNREKAYQTIMEKYGSKEQFYQQIHDKGDLTKSKNHTFNTSNPEKSYFMKLKEKYGENNVLTNYKDQRYPFRCDFYIPSEDLFIELNFHWTHGGMPYEEDNPQCQEKLKVWEEKAKISEFYKQAIITWTIRDVNKRKCAKENNLNYQIIY